MIGGGDGPGRSGYFGEREMGLSGRLRYVKFEVPEIQVSMLTK